MRKMFISFFLCSLFNVIMSAQAYLNTILERLECIQSASYIDLKEAWEPGDTEPVYATPFYMEEYRNPSDTVIGSSYLSWDSVGKRRFEGGYDGTVSASMFHEEKGIVIDDFSIPRAPFRLVSPPFFNYAESIIRYLLGTTDSLTKEIKETEEIYYVKMTIHEENQIEFFGKPCRIPTPPFYMEPTSIYELWVDKLTGLPYKVRREMSHSISTNTVSEVKLNGLDPAAFNLYDCFPTDYEIRMYGQKKRSTSALEGKKAPDWQLADTTGRLVSLSGLRGKIILLNLTGIGCGPCHAAIPFLNTLKGRFPNDLDVVAIDTWGRKQSSIRNYIRHNAIRYLFLEGTPNIAKAYQTGGAAPYFFLLDENRVVRKMFFGYKVGESDKEIIRAIEALLR